MYSPAARPSRSRAAPAKNRTWSTITGISSAIVTANGLPVFSHSARTSSSAPDSMASATRERREAALGGCRAFPLPKASLAERNARSTSSAEEQRCLGENLSRARFYERCGPAPSEADLLPVDEIP